MKMKIETMKKDELIAFAKEASIQLPSKATVPVIRETILSFSSAPVADEKAKDDALKNAKRAKKHAKNKAGRATMAAVYDSFRSLLPEGEKELKLNTVTVEFWKARPDAADFAGCTLRQTGSNPKGFERALLNTIRTAFKDAGFDQITPVIRKGGSGAIHF